MSENTIQVLKQYMKKIGKDLRAIPYLMLLMIIGAALSSIVFHNTNAAMIFLYAFTFVVGMNLGAYMIYNYIFDFIKDGGE